MADILKLTPMTYVVVFGASLSNFASGILEPTIAPYLEILGLPYDMIGFVLSARFLMVAILSVPFALFGIFIGIRTLLYINGFVLLFAGFALLYLPGAVGVFIFFFLLGLTSSIFNGPGIAVIANNTPSKRITAFALFSATWMIPLAIGALLSAIWFIDIEIYSVLNLSSIFFPTSISLSLGSIVYIFFIFKTKSKESPIEQERTINATNRISVKKQFLLLFTPLTFFPLFFLFFTEFLSGSGAGSTLPFLTPYLKGIGASPFELSMLVFILWTLGGIITQFTAPLSKKIGDLNLYILATVLSISSLLGIVFVGDLLISAMFFISRGIFANMVAPVAQNRLVSFIHDDFKALGLAFAGSARWTGWTIFSPISGKIIEVAGYNFSFVFTSLIYLLALIIFIWTVRKYKPISKLATSNA